MALDFSAIVSAARLSTSQIDLERVSLGQGQSPSAIPFSDPWGGLQDPEVASATAAFEVSDTVYQGTGVDAATEAVLLGDSVYQGTGIDTSAEAVALSDEIYQGTGGISADEVFAQSDEIYQGVDTDTGLYDDFTYVLADLWEDSWFLQGASVLDKQEPLKNPLHELTNYTYNLSLHYIGIDQYNLLLNSANPAVDYIPLNVLVAGGGKWNEDFIRHPSFYEDFYFENFTMKTYIGTTNRNRNSNLIECEFTLIEPNGFTFIDRLIDTFVDVENGTAGNYLQVPYMIQIDFYGYDDEGNLINEGIEDFRKFIPVRITNITTKITSKGTEYKVTCVPYNHQAYSQLNSSLVFATAVTGTSVADIFGRQTIDEARRQNRIRNFQSGQRELLNEREQLVGYIRSQNVDPEAVGWGDRQAWTRRITEIETELKSSYNRLEGLSGFCDAMNEWYQYQNDEGLSNTVSSISVVFDPLIGESILLDGSQPTPPSAGANSRDAARAAQGQNVSINFSGGTVNIPATTDITKLIDWAVRNSAYIGQQLQAEQDRINISNGANPNTVTPWLNWFKIVPKIRIGQYDTKLKRYATDIVLYVMPYSLSAKHPNAPKGRVPGFVKKYDYIFTGKNTDVIDLNIDLNTLYMVEVSAIKKKDTTIASNPADGNPPNAEDEYNPYSAFNRTTTRESVPVTGDAPAVVAISQNKTAQTAPGVNQAEKYAAADVQRSLINSAKGDMIQVQLKIVGDPHFIKQDDIFLDNLDPLSRKNSQFTNGFSPTAGSGTNTGASLFMDQAELYVFLNFTTPVDYNELTSTADFNTNYRFSKYSGVYKLLTIDNMFAKGKFEQTLTLAKLFYDQEGKPIDATSFQRETNNNYFIPRARADITRYTGPLVNFARVGTTGGLVDSLVSAVTGTQNYSASAQKATRGFNRRNQSSVSTLDRLASTAVNKLVNQGIQRVGKEVIDAAKDWFQGVPDFEGADMLSQLGELTSSVADYESAQFLSELSQASLEYALEQQALIAAVDVEGAAMASGIYNASAGLSGLSAADAAILADSYGAISAGSIIGAEIGLTGLAATEATALAASYGVAEAGIATAAAAEGFALAELAAFAPEIAVAVAVLNFVAPGVVSDVTEAVSDVASAVGDVVSDVVSGVGDFVSSVFSW